MSTDYGYMKLFACGLNTVFLLFINIHMTMFAVFEKGIVVLFNTEVMCVFTDKGTVQHTMH